MRRLALLFLWIAACGASPATAAPPLIADLSSNHIDLTTSFSGTRLLLFGATESAGDIIVVIRGPASREVVRRKERIAGIWVNRRSVAFETVPGFYFDAATRPLPEIASEKTLRELRIGTSRLALPAVDGDAEAKPEEYRAALLRLKNNAGLYHSSPEPVKVIRDRLFRVEITFPANVPTGPYQVEVHLFRQGKQVAVDRKDLLIRRAGAEAAIYNFAHEHSAMYGIIAIVVALFAGWLAGAIFRKV
jgi:uncharacterized protein (TIGR02186 family)